MKIIPAYMLGIGCENAFLRCNAKYALLIFPDRRFHRFTKLRVFHIEDELMIVRSGIRVKLGSRRERRP
jgi:hypothetical protein